MSDKESEYGKSCNYRYLEEESMIHIKNNVLNKMALIQAPSRLLRICEDQKSGNLIMYFEESMIKLYLITLHRECSVRKWSDQDLAFINNDYIYALHGDEFLLWKRAKMEFLQMHRCLMDLNPEMLDPQSFMVQKMKKGHFIVSTPDNVFKVSPLKPNIIFELKAKKEELEGFASNITIVEAPPAHCEISSTLKSDTCKQPVIPLKLSTTQINESIMKLFQIEYSPNQERFAIFSKDYSEFWVYKAQGVIAEQEHEITRHSCGIRKALFLGSDEYLMSLDTGGKIRILKVDEAKVSCLQTITPDEMENGFDYQNVYYEPMTNHLQFQGDGFLDHYHLDLSSFKSQRQNKLLTYLETESIPTPSATKDQNKATSKAVSIPKSPKHNIPSTSDKTDDGLWKASLAAEPVHKKEAKLREYPLSHVTKERLAGERAKTTRKKSLFSKNIAEINVGIDFGTSRTKVSYYSFTSQQYESLDFSDLSCRENHPEYEDWVIPSIVAVHRDKAVYGYEALSADESARVSDLKRSVLRPGSNIYNNIECAGFLAFVFNEAKIRIQDITGAGSGIRISFSVCLPVTQMIDSELTDHFREMLSFAECIYSENEWNNWNHMKRRYEKLEKFTDLEFTDVIPESVAEVIDLINRKQSPGLYALYDFGAGTTELTIFRIVSSTYQKGCDHIMDTEIIFKGFSDLDAQCKGSIPSDELVREHYQRIWDEFNKVGIWRRMKDAKITGDGSLEPFLNMQIFTSGGASQHPIVQNMFKIVPLFVGHDYLECEIAVLPEPISWDSTKPPYHRFAVSYGLTKNPKETLENFVLPLDCPKVVRATKQRELTEDQILEANKRWLG